MRQRPDVPGVTLLLDPARSASHRDLRAFCVAREAVSEGAPRRRRREPRSSTRQGVAAARPQIPRRLRDHRGASTATVGSGRAHTLSCLRARSPMTATCSPALSGAPRKDLPYGPVYSRHDCVGQPRFAACVHPPRTGLRSRKRQGLFLKACRLHRTPAHTRLPGVPHAGTREGLGGMGGVV